ncbi:MAG: leucine-rich repeat domain-containing protein [Treponema sp.]|nr:leucine-rich repeat domain-containing protein [Treponema sp.]
MKKIVLTLILVSTVFAANAFAQTWTVTSAAELGTVLAVLSANTVTTPYVIIVNVGNTNGIGNELRANPDKFVKIDMSKSAFTAIETADFRECNSIVGIALPDCVTSIGDYAFWGSRNLTGIIIPDSVTKIGFSSFAGCNNLASVTLPDKITRIEHSTFGTCSSLTNIAIPAGVTFIGVQAFRGCTALNNVTIFGRIPAEGFDDQEGMLPSPFTGLGDFQTKYLVGGTGTYTRPIPGTVWTKK